MTKIKRPYSRVYWEALDDPKFAHVWDDDHALAAWLRLLVAADMAWPASATLYHGVRRPAVRLLCEVGLVDMQTSGRYRIHGLDKEREARSDDARVAANVRHHGTADGFPPHTDAEYDRNADGMRPHPKGNAERMPSQDEQSRDKTRQAQTSTTREPQPLMDLPTDDETALCLLAEQLSGTPYGLQLHSAMGQKAKALLAKHGPAAVEKEWRRITAEERGMPTVRQLVLGADNALNRVSSPAPSTPADRKAEVSDFVARIEREVAASKKGMTRAS